MSEALFVEVDYKMKWCIMLVIVLLFHTNLCHIPFRSLSGLSVKKWEFVLFILIDLYSFLRLFFHVQGHAEKVILKSQDF